MDIQLEEGEISDSTSEEGDINPYTPLERPVLHFEPRTLIKKKDASPLEEDATSSKQTKSKPLLNSDSETDDEQIYTKRLKLSPTSPSKTKYDIWNKDPNGDLTDILNQVGMEETPPPESSRNVENYTLPFQKTFNKVSGPYARLKKRKIANRKKFNDDRKQNLKKVVRNLDSLEVNESNTIEEVAEDITKKLKEYNQQLILRIVIVLGKDKAIQMYEKTRVIEKLGGMLILNGSRKRTSGGVFISLVRNDKELPEDKIRAIFEEDAPQQKKIRSAMNKLKRRRKKHVKKNKNANSSELSNPPPSPNLPDLDTTKDVLTELANLDQQKDISELQLVEDEQDDDYEDDILSYEDIDFPEFA